MSFPREDLAIEIQTWKLRELLKWRDYVDIAIVLEEPPRTSREKSRLLNRLWKVMEEKGVPWWYPFEIHLLTKEELSLLEGAKLVRVL